MRIGIDAMGGDFAPLEAVKGAIEAKQLHPKWELVLFGIEEEIRKVFTELQVAEQDYQLVHCDEVIEMSEHPVKAISSKPSSSINVGYGWLAQGKIDAFLSAGNTGAMLVGALHSVKAIDGVQRPCLTSVVPRINNHPGLLLDVGANADCKPEILEQFAILGALFYKHIYKVDQPKVGLLNIGEEEEKGNLLTKATYKLLQANQHIHFVGNVEGRDIFSDRADVLVCDGFTGNMVIKVCEGMFYRLLKRGVKDDFLNQFNFNNYGGTPILGVNAPAIIGHGISKSDTFVKMIELSAEVAETHLSAEIKKAFNQINSQSSVKG